MLLENNIPEKEDEKEKDNNKIVKKEYISRTKGNLKKTKVATISSKQTSLARKVGRPPLQSKRLAFNSKVISKNKNKHLPSNYA